METTAFKLTRQGKIKLEVIHQFKKRHFAITHAFSILTRFDINFLENASGFIIAGSPREMD